MIRRALILVAALASVAGAATTFPVRSLEPAGSDQSVPLYDATGGVVGYYVLDPSDFTCDDGTDTCGLHADVTLLGMTIGDAGGELASGTSLPGTCDAGELFIETDVPLDPLAVSTSANQMRSVAGRYLKAGGDGADGDFSWDGSTGCSQGTPSGSTCVLPANSPWGRALNDAGTTLYSCNYHFDDFTLTGGTVTCFQSGAFAATTVPPTLASGLIIRVAGTLTLTGGTVDMAGKGAVAGAGVSTAGSGTARNGGAGGVGSFFPAAAGGIGASSTAPVAGAAAPTTPRFFPSMPIVLGYGGGGGGGANAGAAGSLPVNGNFGLASFGMIVPQVGGLGGGGGYCTSSATTGGTSGAGGRGGGAIRFEVAGDYACSGATFNSSGSNGANVVSGQAAGGGGGGGGSIELIYRTSSSDTCTYTVSGGSGGSAGTNCSAGAAGGTGRKFTYQVPQ